MKNYELFGFWKNFSRIKQCHSEAEKAVKRISFLENDGTTKDSDAKILANQNYSLNLQRMTKSYYYGDFIYGRQWNVMKKIGYDYVDR